MLSLKDESRLLSVTVTVTVTLHLMTVCFPSTHVQSVAKPQFWVVVVHCHVQHAGPGRSSVSGTVSHCSGCAQEVSIISKGPSLDVCHESRIIDTGFCLLAKPRRSRCARSTFVQYIPQSSLHWVIKINLESRMCPARQMLSCLSRRTCQ